MAARATVHRCDHSPAWMDGSGSSINTQYFAAATKHWTKTGHMKPTNRAVVKCNLAKRMVKPIRMAKVCVFGCGWIQRAHYSSKLLRISPLLRVTRAERVQSSVDSARKRTEPSAKAKLAPPEWKL